MPVTRSKKDILEEMKQHKEIVERYSANGLLPEYEFIFYNNSRKALVTLQNLLDNYYNEPSK